MCLLVHAIEVGININWDSYYLQLTFKMVVEHIHKLVLGRVHRARHSNHALELVLTLTDQAPFPYIDVTWTWINKLLESAAEGRIEDRTFFLFLRLRGL